MSQTTQAAWERSRHIIRSAWGRDQRQTYGTILVDLERRQPVALLPDRTAETVAQWLQEHPGVQVIARDRSTAYAEGARHGAPAATQVADRFHLLQNLREALDQVFSTHSQALDAVNALVHQQPVLLADGALAVSVPPHAIPLPAQQRAAERQAHRQALHTHEFIPIKPLAAMESDAPGSYAGHSRVP